MARTAPGYRDHPDHHVNIAPVDGQHEITLASVRVASTKDAYVVHETALRPVVYFPPQDVDGALLIPSERRTHCPFKGSAVYWSVEADGARAEDAAWAYPDPFDEFRLLKDYVAFYLDRFSAYRIDGEDQALAGPGWVAPHPLRTGG